MKSVLLLLLLVSSVCLVLACKRGPMHETFICGGSQETTLSKCTIDVPAGTAVIAGGDCKLTLDDCTVNGDTAITAGGGAVVTIKGGSVTGITNSFSVGGNAAVSVNDTKVAGPVSTGGHGKLTGVDQAAAASAAPPRAAGTEADLKKGACDGYFDCYGKNDAYGQVQGRVTIQISATGAITQTTYDSGQAPDAVKKCILDVAKNKKLPGYSLGAGELVCQYAGTYMKGTQMMSTDVSFSHKP